MRCCQAMAGTIWYKTILNQSVLKLVDQVSLINQNFSLLSCCQYRAIARLSNGNKWKEIKFNTVKNKEHHLLLSVKTQQSVWWCKHSQPYLHQLHVLCSNIQCFNGSHLLCSAFRLCFLHPSPPLPHPFPPLFSTDISMLQVPGAIDIGAHCWEVQVYQPWEWLTLSRGWLYQNWEPLDILGTHLHCTLSDAVVNIHKTRNGISDFIKWVEKIDWPL